MSRQTIYSEELANTICDRLTDGESLRRICLDESMPNRSTVLRWLESDEAFAAKYAHARDLQADLMDDYILDTAHGCTTETAMADRVKIGAYQWRASKLKPKKYGDKVEQTHVGDKERPIYMTPVDADI